MLSDYFRIALPYGMVRGENREWAAFNREYKPVGFNTDETIYTLPENGRGLPVYTFYPALTDSVIMEITGYDESAVKRDEHGNICQFWLYGDATNPMNQREMENPHWKAYWEKLEILARLTLVRTN
jgi:hypothetical protein